MKQQGGGTDEEDSRVRKPLFIRIAAIFASILILLSVISVVRYTFRQKVECYSETEHDYRTERMDFEDDGKRIYGVLYVPEGTGPFPVIIMSHGFNSSADFWERTARSMAKSGYACYCFDFCGGNTLGRSDGSMLEMSAVTEKENLSFIIGKIEEQDFTDPDHLYLMGESLGGCVTAITAPDFSDRIRAMVLYYPALNLSETVRDTYPELSDIPDHGFLLGKKVGRIFYSDAWSLNINAAIEGYDGPVLLIHGTSDQVVNISVSEKAELLYKDARLIRLDGEPHGFSAAGREKASRDAYEFFAEYS